jgi:hypothetical protein
LITDSGHRWPEIWLEPERDEGTGLAFRENSARAQRLARMAFSRIRRASDQDFRRSRTRILKSELRGDLDQSWGIRS